MITKIFEVESGEPQVGWNCPKCDAANPPNNKVFCLRILSNVILVGAEFWRFWQENAQETVLFNHL
jgi:hypothetical protein